MKVVVAAEELVAEVVAVVGLAPEEAASLGGKEFAKPAAAVAGEAAAAKQAVVAVVDLHNLPAVAEIVEVAEVGSLLLVAAAALVEEGVAAAAALAAVSAALHSVPDFRRVPSVERRGLSGCVCGVQSIVRAVVVFLEVPFFVAENCWPVHPRFWYYHKHRDRSSWVAQF